LVIKIKIHIVT